MPRTAALISALALLLAAALPSTASAGPPRAAVQFVSAFERAADTAEVFTEGLARRVEATFAPCTTVVDAIGAGDPRRKDVEAFVSTASVQETTIEPLLPVLAQLTRELDAIRTRDRVLRTARSVWRAQYDTLVRFPRVDDVCGQLIRWRDTGFAPGARPAIATETPLDLIDPADESRTAAKLERAVRRLRTLGVSRKRAALVEGAGLVAPIAAALKQTDPAR